MMDNLELKALFHCVAEHQDTPVKWDWKTGICANICELMELDFMTMEQVNHIEKLMWECAGGDTAYPVPASPDAMHGLDYALPQSAVDCYWVWEDKADMYTGSYGRSRRELALYIARNL